MLSLLLNQTLFLLLCAGLLLIARQKYALSRQVLAGLLMGAGLGALFQFFYSPDDPTLQTSLAWINIVGSGYIRLLKLVIMPLVLVSILGAMVRMHNTRSLGKISLYTLGTLLTTTAIAAMIAVFTSVTFGLNASTLLQGAQSEVSSLLPYVGKLEALDPPRLLVSFIPDNIFLDLTGARQTSVIGVVIFAMLIGFVVVSMAREKSPYAKPLIDGICALQDVIMRLVRLIMRLTPWGVMALMTRVVANTSLESLASLGGFMAAIYLAIGLMFLCHGLIVTVLGMNPLRYFGKIWPVLTLAFSSTSSAACLPLNIETQTHSLKVHPAIANFSASIGATAGMNGCAGIYPAMLATMVAVSVGISITPAWVITLCAVILVCSFGLAGVGGGGTFAALMVLSAMGLPLELVGLLIAIEPVVDMGRTALNVSGAILSGVVTNRLITMEDDSRVEGTAQVMSS
ncbi:L-cystine transporter [Kistimonas scapharcae]|uniref:L-cystine transporter n=1 Tax=Kistimonas scapharcae TaxID=1036133 RepID=A0ABP8V3F4_9GAMM